MTLDLSMSKVREVGRPIMRPDGTVDIDGIDFSAVDMWLRCGQQYAFRHLNGMKSPPGIALAEGVAHHTALEADNVSKLTKGKSLKASAMTEVFHAELDKLVPIYEKECEELKTRLDWDGEKEGDLMDRAVILHEDYAKRFSPKIEPEAAEKAFSDEINVSGVKFRLYGQIDLLTKRKVTDYKTTKRVKGKRDVEESLQLSLYAHVAKRRKVSIISLVKEKPHVEEVEADRTDAEIMWALRVAASAVSSIRLGSFPLTKPDPMNWICSARFCGYWSKCRGKA